MVGVVDVGVTIKDLAREAEVSITTVSRVLNNKPGVSAATREKIRRLVKIMGYNPNSIARGLVLNQTFLIGLIIPDIRNPFFPEMARGVEDRARELGYSVIYYNTDKNREEEKKAFDLLLSKQVDGVILSFFSWSIKKTLLKLNKIQYPVVRVDSNLKKSIYPSVIIDSISSAYQATEYLIKMGHQKIGHITGRITSRTARHYLIGYKNCLRDYQLAFHKQWLVRGDFEHQSGYQQMKELLRQQDKPTAVFIANDIMAFGAYKAIAEMGYTIPDDISIIAHDDIELSSYLIPGLTTMYTPKYRLGIILADLLIKQIKIKNRAEIDDVVLKSTLVERSSVKRLR